MIYDVQDISFSVPTNDRYENFGLMDPIYKKFTKGYMNYIKNAMGGEDLGQIANNVITGIMSGNLSPIQQYWQKFNDATKTKDQKDAKNTTTTQPNTDTNTEGADWLGNIGQFIKEHPWITAGGALTALNMLSKGLQPKAQMGYGYGMPQMPMMYPMMMPQMQPMMAANYGYGYGNGLQSILNTVAPIVTGYGISKFLNSKPAAKVTETPTASTTTPASTQPDLSSADEYAQELMESFPEKSQEILSNLNKFSKKYPNNPERIKSALKGLAQGYNIAASKVAQQTEAPEPEEDLGHKGRFMSGLNTIEGFHPVLNHEVKKAQSAVDKLLAVRGDKGRDDIEKRVAELEATGISRPKAVLQVYKEFGDHPVQDTIETIKQKSKSFIDAAKQRAAEAEKQRMEKSKETNEQVAQAINAMKDMVKRITPQKKPKQNTKNGNTNPQTP